MNLKFILIGIIMFFGGWFMFSNPYIHADNPMGVGIKLLGILIAFGSSGAFALGMGLDESNTTKPKKGVRVQ